MPYNASGDLFKSEIVKKLQNMGCNIKNVHELNVILEKMGILKHYGNKWLTTDAGVKYTIFRGPVFDAAAWNPSIIKAIYSFLQGK